MSEHFIKTNIYSYVCNLLFHDTETVGLKNTLFIEFRGKNPEDNVVKLNAHSSLQIHEVRQKGEKLRFLHDKFNDLLFVMCDDFLRGPIVVVYDIPVINYETEENNGVCIFDDSTVASMIYPNCLYMFIPCISQENDFKAQLKVNLTLSNKEKHVVTGSFNYEIMEIQMSDCFKFEEFVKKIPLNFFAFAIGSFVLYQSKLPSGFLIEVYCNEGETFTELEFLENAICLIENYLELKELGKIQIVLISNYPNDVGGNIGILFLDNHLFVNFDENNKRLVLKKIILYLILTINYTPSIWIIEGISELLSFKLLEKMNGKIDYNYYLLNYYLYVLINDIRCDCSLDNYLEIHEFNEISELFIKKSTCIMKMIFDKIGEEMFLKLIKKFLYDFKESSPDHKIFLDIFDKFNYPFVNPWFTQNGYPIVILDNDGNLHQTRFTTSNNSSNEIWKIPLEIVKYTKLGNIKETIIMDKKEMKLNLENVEMVIINPENKTLCRVMYQKHWLDLICANIDKLSFEQKIMMKINILNLAQMGLISKTLIGYFDFPEIKLPKNLIRVFPMMRGSKNSLLQFTEL